jgi:hypothetical protein
MSFHEGGNMTANNYDEVVNNLERAFHYLQSIARKEGVASWVKDALELLKEDCHNCKLECLLQKYDQLKEKYDKLLKEQEPKPVGKEWNECPSCGKTLDRIHDMHYCGVCGQAVKWDA